MPTPPSTLLPELDHLLGSRSPRVVEGVRRVVANVRPCVRLRSERIGARPIRGGVVDRLLGRPRTAPVLPATASKFGGLPYFESETELRGGRFLGQVNVGEVRTALARDGFPVPAGMPERGLLAIDIADGRLGGRTRWYPDPQVRALPVPEIDPVARYEAAIRFEGSWSLRGLDWFDPVPAEDEELWEYMNDLEIPGVDADGDGSHKLFGHANEALNEHCGFPSDLLRRGEDRAAIREYELIWRIDYDHPAGFSWGTNWLYVVIHRADLARGALEKSIVLVANA